MTQLDDMVQAIRDVNVPGVVLGVSVPGQGDFIGVSGSASLNDPTPIDANARFRIASITKTFVATVILQLVGECRLSLDDAVSEWQPTVGDADIITVRDFSSTRAAFPTTRARKCSTTSSRCIRSRSGTTRTSRA